MEKNKETSALGTGRRSEPVAWVVGKSLPTGTVTFLFTDIEGSTPHWESHPDLMEEALKIHNEILFTQVQENGGQVFKIVGDEFQSAFPTARQALKAAVDIQFGLQGAAWNALGPLKVRIGLHTGEAHPDDIGDEYAVSHTKNRVGRIRSAAHGGQVLLSKETADLCETLLPEGVQLRYLGEFRMKGLARREPIFQATAVGLPDQFPPLATLADPQHNLPRQLTPFIGREKEIAQVKALLAKNSLVTLVGSGGVGKTRLGIQVAEDLVEDFPDGVWFIELAPLSDPGLVAQTIALALGLREDSGRSFQDALESFLKSRQALLVLDNCEHLIEACARLADSLLHHCPQVRLLATSREALGVVGEVMVHLPSLAMPDMAAQFELNTLSGYDALRLFVERGQVVLPSFKLTTENASHVISICQRLDGIPLALELAAARLHVLSTEQLASRLDDAFRLLVGGARTAVPRQQTLRATIDWSYRLLDPTEQSLLRRLSVFIGGFGLEAVEAVCAGEGIEEGNILDLLTSLVNKSIVNADRVQGEVPRYHLLETVRQYAREKLYDAGESAARRDRHLAYFVDFTERAEPHIHGPGRLEWTAYLKTEYPNIREALDWAFNESSTAVDGLRIAAAITDRFWFCLGYNREGEGWLKRGLQVSGEMVPPSLEARVVYSLGRLLSILDIQQCQSYLDQCITMCREIGSAANRELALALTLSANGIRDPQEALNRSEEGVQVARSLASSDSWPLAESLFFRANVLFLLGSVDQAFTTAQECVRVAEKGDRWMSGGYWVLGLIQAFKGQPELARRNLEIGLELSLAVDDLLGIWYSLAFLGWLSLRMAKFEQASVYYRDLLKLNDRFKMLGHFYDLAFIGVLLARGQKEMDAAQMVPGWLDAVRMLAAFDKWYTSNFTLGFEFAFEDHQGALDVLRHRIDPAAFDTAWEEGKAMAEPLEEALQYALTVLGKYTFEDRVA